MLLDCRLSRYILHLSQTCSYCFIYSSVIAVMTHRVGRKHSKDCSLRSIKFKFPLPGKGLLQNASPLGYAKQANAPWWLGGGGACLDLTDTLVLSIRFEFTIKAIGQTQFIHQIVSYPLEAGCTEAK